MYPKFPICKMQAVKARTRQHAELRLQLELEILLAEVSAHLASLHKLLWGCYPDDESCSAPMISLS